MTEWLRCSNPECFYKLRHCHPASPPAPRTSARIIDLQRFDRLTASLHDPVPIFRRIAELARTPGAPTLAIADIADAAAELFTTKERSTS